MRLELNSGAGTLTLALAALPYVIEVLSQLSLQARFVATLPPETRATVPPHSRRPLVVFFGSLRFQLALWRFVRTDLPDDPVAVTALKHRMRASLISLPNAKSTTVASFNSRERPRASVNSACDPTPPTLRRDNDYAASVAV